MQRFFLAALAATALAACGNTNDDRSRMAAGSANPPASAVQAPMNNVGQSPAVTSGSASNTASGSRATPAR